MAEIEEAVEQEDDAYALDRETIREVRDAVDAEDRDRLMAAMEPMHPADIADLLEQLDESPRHRLIHMLGHDFDGAVLSELDEGLREDIIRTLSPEVLTGAVRGLESDDVVDLLEDLEEPQQEAILEALERPDRIAIERALSFPDGSAGRLMQREVVTAPEHWTVGDAIDFMRASLDLPEQFYHIVLVDPRFRPVGQVTLGKVMSSDRVTPLKELLEPSYRTIPATQDEEDVAYAFNQYHLISAPVVDEDERLVGVITIDDAMTVLSEENEEDLLLLAGVGDESIADRTLQIAKVRFPWLLVNLGTAILASLVIAQFEDVLAAVVALAVLMPIVASMGGNAGTQSMTVAVRAIATRDLTGSNGWRVVRREVMAGFLNGLAFAVIIGIVSVIWFGSPMLGVVIAAAMVINLIVAGLAGVLVPICMDKAGVDPALASGTFVTTVTDVVGFFAFLGLAGLVLL
ncbi:Magnesium transporter MgtE [Rhodobacteraceae bacterium THAF1]|uniref:magnesium transporter n=1 Tax=Palleronia sp. THAF1 TaxID=2587842 RepID=UPI000F3D88F7|nr:magnesium transporter [Palleronia sp. THAF1]QFU07968.1 Magnesium transporter MgtE [Palleronia sp. THAF1]VDC27819.1 Magnesium transporter MgtE [Rhodobacteraceae bacterium THAF1]